MSINIVTGGSRRSPNLVAASAREEFKLAGYAQIMPVRPNRPSPDLTERAQTLA